MEKHLKELYGFNNFRDYQKDIIKDILNNENIFAVLPTGGGKSLLYQFPATYTGKTTIVISPLISLMNDQCIYLNSKNIKSVCLNSETSVNVSQYKDYKIIYTTPEFIVSRIPAFKLMKEYIGLFAIDEAHCVSQWSHDFRPSYQKLRLLKQHFKNVPILAVTATATPKVLEEMHTFLGVNDCCEYLLGTRRTNLAINILPKSKFKECVYEEPTIIYVSTRKLCEKISNDLNNKNIKSCYYHGGMSKKDKEISHKKFIGGEINVIVATISFGMGIDKADIRHVINFGVPSDIETYYQEIGRAGRDGINSKATIYYDDGDFMTISYLISNGDPSQIDIKTHRLNMLSSYLKEKNICRQQIIDYYFETGKYPNESQVEHIPKCNMCDNCLRETNIELIDITKESTCIVNILTQNAKYKKYDLGLKKTIKNIKTHKRYAITPPKSDKFITDVIDVLISKNILRRYKPPKGYGLVIGLGDVLLNTVTPIKARIEENEKVNLLFKDYHFKGKKLIDLMELRNKLAKKFNLIPGSFINDRVINNIYNKKPRTLNELWKVDGISNEFIMTEECIEFMNEYKIMNGFVAKKKKGRANNREKIYKLYKQNKRPLEISTTLGLNIRTIHNHILYIYEHYEDVDIDLDYYDLSQEKEDKIKAAIREVGTKYLKPIKDIVGKKISYEQIKLCIIVMKIEE